MIIGLIGMKEAGKTTVAEYLESKYGFTRLNMKDALIEELKRLFPDLLEALKEQYEYNTIDDLFYHKPKLVRTLMQNFGTDVRKEHNENYWVDKWRDAYKKLQGNVVVDDVRFLSEYEEIKSKKGIMFRVVKLGQQQTSTHISELEQSNLLEDILLEVEPGDIPDLQKKVDYYTQLII